MEVAARSRLLAGAALVGAGALVAAPIQPVPDTGASPIIQSATPAVELAALVNPIELWSTVISQALANTGELAGIVLDNPAPIAGKVIDNQLITADVLTMFVTKFGVGAFDGIASLPAALQASFDAILAGQIYDGTFGIMTALLSPVVVGALTALEGMDDLVAVLQNPLLNTANVIGTVISMPTLIGVGLPLLTEVLSPVLQAGFTGQAIHDGVTAGDFEAVADALISFPSDLVGTFLNGTTVFEPNTNGILGVPSGLVASLLSVRRAIADAIQPPALTPPDAARGESAPEPSVNSFTFTVDEGGEIQADVPEALTGKNIQAVAAKPGGQGSVGDAKVSEPVESSVAPVAATTETTDTIETVERTEVESEPTEKAESPAEKTKQKKPLVTLGNKFAPTTTAGEKTRPGQRAEAALKSIGDEVNKTVKKALGVKSKKKADAGGSSSGNDNTGGEE